MLSIGTRVMDGRRVVPRHRHHAGARRTAAAATAAAVDAAKRAGARVSVDLNYRKKLWTRGAGAGSRCGPLMRDVDVVIANEEDLQSVLGIHVEGTDVTTGSLNVDAYRAAAERGDARARAAAGRDHAAREPLGQ